MKIFVAVISRNQPYWACINQLNVATNYAYTYEEPIRIQLYPHVGDSLVCRARNECLAIFRESNADYLFTLDDDVVLPPDVFPLLVKANKGMIGGMYLLKTKKNNEMWLSGRTRDEVDLAEWAAKPESEQYIPMDYISTGCVLHSREFIEKMWDHYKGDPELEYDNLDSVAGSRTKSPIRLALYRPMVYNREYLSEDWAFCRRAINAGFHDDLWLHAGVRCAHWGMTEYHFPSEWNAFKGIGDDNKTA